MSTMHFTERIASQIPAVKLLINSGYEYLTPNDCMEERENTSNVLLKDTLKKSLLKFNSFTHKGEQLPIPENIIDEAIKEIADWNNHNLRADNKDLYYHLINGKGLTFSHDGDQKSAHLYFFDFNNLTNNKFQVTEEFKVQRNGRKQHYIPDVIILINGMPVSSIECKKPGLPDAISKGIEQHIRNQNREGITKFYLFQQVLGSMAGSTGAKYGSVGTPEEFWGIWKEDSYLSKEDALKSLVNKDVDKETKEKMFSFRHPADRAVMESKWKDDREVTVQDQLLFHVFRPERLLDIFHNFIIYEDLVKIAPRHQQYFAVKEALIRVKQKKEDGSREGGVIWHTTGSGKSYTMVMVAKALSGDKEIETPKIVVVTDRVDLDNQIKNTFKDCGEEPHQAKSGDDLAKRIESKDYRVLTTIIDKFKTVAETHKKSDSSDNIFVLVDEGHRSQFGETHSLMKNTFPKASFIGFTGTPIRRVRANEDIAQATEVQFGEFIHKYTMENALEDGAVCPIVYEGRMNELKGDREQLDRWFDRVTRDLNEDQKTALKKKFSMEQEVLKAEDRIKAISMDIRNHYRENFRAEGEPIKGFMKGQLATNSKGEALNYKRFLEELGMKVALIVSPPDMREGAKTIDNDDRPEIVKFWDSLPKNYEIDAIEGFKNQDEPEILIVVDKLLTGFDAPRNAVLYIDKKLKEHNVLQAIARVNRLCPRKEEGLVIDYRGIFDDMNSAIDFYRKMENDDYDGEDLKGALVDKEVLVAKMDAILKDLEDHFSNIKHMSDDEEIGRYLANEDLRKEFYQKFRNYHNVYKLAQGFSKWTYETTEAQKKHYKVKYKYFAELRTVIQERYPEGINYKDYVDDIKRLVDTNLKADPPRIIVEKYNIFDKEKFEDDTKEKSPGARADIIKSLASAHASEHFDEDPIFYKKLSEVIQEAYEKYRDRRISDAEYLEMMEDVNDRLTINLEDDVPKEVSGNQTTKAYYRVIETVKNKIENFNNETISELALKVDAIVKKYAVRDWHLGNTVEKKIISSIEAEIYYFLEDTYKIAFSEDEMKEMTDNFMLIAKRLDYR